MRFFLFVYHPVFLFQPADDAVDGLFQILHGHLLASVARGQERSLVEDVFQIRAREPRCALGQNLKIHILRQADALGVHL
jgi:hypothetical protein